MIFALVSAFLFITTAYMMKKKIHYIEMYTTTLFAMVFQLIVDTILDLKFDLYGYFEDGVDIQTLIVILLIYPPLNIIFLNFFPLRSELFIQILYFIVWCLFALLYEYLSVEIGFFYYKNWSLWYSALIYPFVYGLILVNFFSVRKLLSLYKIN